MTNFDYARHRFAARKLVHERVKFYCDRYGFKPGKISIRNQRSRWGSCNRQGDLNFNYRLVELTPELADYVIVHELCHTQELNHSAKFWGLVASIFPNYKPLNKGLRKFSIGASPN